MAETKLAKFKKRLEAAVLDPQGIHHEFVSGLHGRKLDFDTIPTEDDLFFEWVEVVADYLTTHYPKADWSKTAILSVANGTNRLVGPIAEKIGRGVKALQTEKLTPKSVKLTAEAEKFIKTNQPELIIAIEDVGTKGTTSASAVEAARSAGAKKVEAVNTWQRRDQLEELDKIKAPYSSIIKEALPTYTPEECRERGYCSQNWQFVPHE